MEIPHSKILDTILEILRDDFYVEGNVCSSSSLKSLRLDSLDVVGLVIRAEDIFHIHIDDTVVSPETSVLGLVNIIHGILTN